LKRLAEDLKKYPNIKIEIAGHTDNVGTDENNDLLSQNRAESVYSYLVSIGCNKDKMQARGYGERKPVATNSTEAGRAENRRVEIKFLK